MEQWDEAAFDLSFATNVKGPYFLIQALLPILANPASIVVNASINAHIGMPNSQRLWRHEVGDPLAHSHALG